MQVTVSLLEIVGTIECKFTLNHLIKVVNNAERQKIFQT